MSKIVIASDSFKGSLSSLEVASHNISETVAKALESLSPSLFLANP